MPRVAKDPPTTRRRALIAAAAAAVVAFTIAHTLELELLRLLSKPAPVLLLAAAVLDGPRARGAATIALGLVFSAAGDLLLALGEETFLLGVAAFFAAHLCYIAAFVRRRAAPSLPRALPFMLYGGLVFRALQPHLGALEAPVAAYCAAISVMGWRALALLGGDDPRPSRLAAAGALAFVASDTILAFHLFRAPITGASAAIMGLYWLGQLGIAASTWSRPRPRH